jgi:sulfite exporter TauE/SafE
MTNELVLLAAFAAGFLGSSHCAGMCGPIVVLFEGKPAAQGRITVVWRRVLYNTGRGLFYVSLGAVAGLSGSIVAGLLDLQAATYLLRIVAAGMVVIIGLHLMGFTRFLGGFEKKGVRIWQWLSPLTLRLLPIKTSAQALAAGFLWGALPCGLVYSSLALAATSGGALAGALTMALFWLGTLPLLLFIGTMGHRLRAWRGRRGYRRAAGFVLVIGALAAIIVPILLGSPHDQHQPASITQEHNHG